MGWPTAHESAQLQGRLAVAWRCVTFFDGIRWVHTSIGGDETQRWLIQLKNPKFEVECSLEEEGLPRHPSFW